MLNHTELMESWASDAKIDPTQLLERMHRHPMLHSKYLTILQTYKLQSRKLLLKYQRQKQFKMKYYNGELTKPELDAAGLTQYQYKRPLKSEMETLLEADPELQLIQEQVLYTETLTSSAESILKDITNQYYLYRNIIEQTKFLAGEN